jgi:hypothetical protein
MKTSQRYSFRASALRTLVLALVTFPLSLPAPPAGKGGKRGEPGKDIVHAPGPVHGPKPLGQALKDLAEVRIRKLNEELRKANEEELRKLKEAGKDASAKTKTASAALRSEWIKDGVREAEHKLGMSTSEHNITEKKTHDIAAAWCGHVASLAEYSDGLTLVQKDGTRLFIRKEEFKDLFDEFWKSCVSGGFGFDGSVDGSPERFMTAVKEMFSNGRQEWAHVVVQKFDGNANLSTFSGITRGWRPGKDGRLRTMESRVCLVVNRVEEVQEARAWLGDKWWTRTQVVWNQSGDKANAEAQLSKVAAKITVIHGMPRTFSEGRAVHGAVFEAEHLPEIHRCRDAVEQMFQDGVDAGAAKAELRHMHLRHVDLAQTPGQGTMAERAAAVISAAGENELVVQLGCVVGTEMVYADGSRLPLQQTAPKCQLLLLGCQTALKTEVAAGQAKIGTLRNITYDEAMTAVLSLGMIKHAAFSIMEKLMWLEKDRRRSLTPESKAKGRAVGPGSPFVMIAHTTALEVKTTEGSEWASVPAADSGHGMLAAAPPFFESLPFK